MRVALPSWGMLIGLAPGLLLGVGPSVAFAQTANPSFNLVNRGTQAIGEVYATPAGVDRWGRDRLERSYVPPGQSFPVRLPADGNCLYDIRVVYADGRPEERRRVNTCGVDAVVFPGGRVDGAGPDAGAGRAAVANDPSFRLVNRARSEVNQVFVSPVGEEGWGRDRLGDGTVAAGATRVIRLPSGACTYDVRVVFSNGEALERRRLDLCAVTDLRVP